MKRILIVCTYFGISGIGSVRPSRLAKQLVSRGYEVTTIAPREWTIREDNTLDADLVGNVLYIEESKLNDFLSNLYMKREARIKLESWKAGYSNNINSKKSVKNAFFRIVTPRLKSVYYYVLNYNQRFLTKKAIARVGANNYDIVITTWPLHFPLYFGLRYKKNHEQTMWIVDLRDPIISFFIPKKWTKYHKSLAAKISETADIITGISDGCLVDFQGKCDEKLHVITNGFDRDDLSSIAAVPSDKFTLTYTGTLYKDRSIIIIIMALKELIDEGRVDKNKLQINYAGHSEREFMNQIAQYDLLDIVKNHGLIDRRKSLELQLGSSILVLLSWNSVGSEGAITGKFFEHLMVDKPIICTVTGNLANSKLKEMIEEANVGAVWEEANSDEDYPVLKSYILEQYKCFIRGEPLLFEPNREYIEQFNYKNITQQYIDLIEEHVTNIADDFIVKRGRG